MAIQSRARSPPKLFDIWEREKNMEPYPIADGQFSFASESPAPL